MPNANSFTPSLSRRAQLSRAANKRYLDALASTQVGTPLGQAAAPLCRRITYQGRPYRALNPLNPSDAALLGALSRGEWTITGLGATGTCNRCFMGPSFNTKGRRAAARRRSVASCACSTRTA